MAHDETLHSDTFLAQALGRIDERTGDVVRPPHLATTYVRDASGALRDGRLYARSDNPSFEDVELLLTRLEGGQASMLFSSGMAAASAVFMSLSPGDHVVASAHMYWALRRFLWADVARFGISVSLVQTEDLDMLRAAVSPHTKLVWIETPSNPACTITDIAAAAAVAHQVGAHLCVDSTLATPVLSKPIEHGADIVMHAATKYLNGHSDVLAGTLTTRNADERWKKIAGLRSTLGGVPGGLDAFLLLRGMRTLHLRVARASASAQKLAEALSCNPHVAQLLYAGLPSAPGHEIAKRQMKGGFGGVLSMRVKGGSDAADRVAARTKLWKRATSLGGVESLIEHRAPIEGATSDTPVDLLRLSVGIEDPGDLLADLEAALASAVE